MNRAIDLQEFLETYQGRQLLVWRLGLGAWKTCFLLWTSFILCPVVCKTINMSYYRWMFFEVQVPTKEANSKNRLQLNNQSN